MVNINREFVVVGQKVVPHSKSFCGNLESSVNWYYAKNKNQPYLFVSKINYDYIVLDCIRGSNRGDFFLPEDFEPYIENNANQENNNESRNIKMKKSDLNNSMLFKMRDGDLCALLDDIEGNMIFNNQEDIKQGYSSYFITLNDYDEELSSDGDDYDIVAIKQLDSCVRVVCDVLDENEPEEWDWVEDVKEENDVEDDKSDNESKNENNVVNNITINITVDSNEDPANFLKQLNDALKKNGLH